MEKVQRWLGEAAGKELLLEHFRRAFLENPVPGELYYAHTYPEEKRSLESLYTLRLCRFEIEDGASLQIQAAFDGALQKRVIHNGDILLGSYNGSHKVLNEKNATFSGVSVVFHTHHTRLHCCRFEKGDLVKNIYYYSPRAAEGALLHMARALDIFIHDTEQERDRRCRPLMDALFRQLYYEFTLPREEEEKEPTQLARRIKYYLENNFYRMINCSDICEELGINRTYAAKVFHENFNMTMNEHLLALRFEAAANLLLSQKHLRIEEVAALCAFPDAGYFTRSFRKYFGVTPGDYRKMQNLKE